MLIQIDKRLIWKQQINEALKLNKAMLSNWRLYVLDTKTLRSIYYAIFESHLCYASLWAQNTNSIKRLDLLPKKSLRIMFFQSRNLSKILKSFDKTALENWIFNSKFLSVIAFYLHVEFPWVLVFDLGISKGRGVTKFCRISRGESFSVEFLRVKGQI